MLIPTHEITRDNIEEILKRDVERFKRSLRNFPFDCCTEASKRLCRRHSRTHSRYNRFRLINGKYCGPISSDYIQKYRTTFGAEYPEIPDLISHTFVYDHGIGLFIDVTASQFHPSNPEVLLMPSGDERISYRRSKINGKTTHYVDNSIFAELVAEV